MYYLNKIVGALTNPLVVAMGGIALALLLSWLGRKKDSRLVWTASIVWLWFWATPLAGRWVGVPLEREFLVDGRIPAIESYPLADAIELHGGGMGDDAAIGGRGEMWTSADRVWMAARLYKAGKAPKLYVTGTGAATCTIGLLQDFGVPTNAIVVAEAPRNTEEEAKLIAERLGIGEEGLGIREQGLGRREKRVEEKAKVLVVTSAWHMKRTRLMYEKYAPNVDAIPAPCDFENTIGTMDGWRSFSVFPNPTSLMWNTITFHEWAGIVGYLLFR